MVVNTDPSMPEDTRPIKFPADIVGINQSEYIFGMFCKSALSEILPVKKCQVLFVLSILLTLDKHVGHI